MRRVGDVVGSQPAAVEAAEAQLAAGQDAIGAAVAGFFAAAGQFPGVLMGPSCLVVAHVGMGARAFDGRLRQPGLGAKRPRGLSATEAASPAARVAAPTSIAALLVALRYGRGASLSSLLSAGVSAARQAGASRRAELLEHVQRLGAAALSEPAVMRPLVHRAGFSEGGALTAADLAAAPQVDYPARAVDCRYEAPWRAEAGSVDERVEEDWPEFERRQEALGVADASGGVAALCYDHAASGLVIDELELVLPLAAVPVRRGQKRVTPGQALPAPVPVAVELTAGGVPTWARIELPEASLVVHAPDRPATDAAVPG